MNIIWGCTPEAKVLAEKLSNLDAFPLQGECELKYTKNRHLDRFRRAQNVVYDIFNNGLCNRAKEAKILGLAKRDLPLDVYDYSGRFMYPANWDRIEEMVEEKFTPFVMAAAKEQGLLNDQ